MDKPQGYIHYERRVMSGYYNDQVVKKAMVVVGRLAMPEGFVWLLGGIAATAVLTLLIVGAAIEWTAGTIPAIITLGLFTLWLIYITLRSIARYIRNNFEWRGPR